MKPDYRGAETKKAEQNFHPTHLPVDLRFIHALLMVKKATISAHTQLGTLSKEVGKALLQATEEGLTGQLDTQFTTDSIQGGAGTSVHMNVNEVLANRATEILGKTVHPIDHANLSQSTNDVIPTAFRLATLRLLDELTVSLQTLSEAFQKKAEEGKKVIKVGRTHLQDAVPITFEQEFSAYANLIQQEKIHLFQQKKALYETNLGGTAIGSGITASQSYTRLANEKLAELSGYDFHFADNPFAITQHPTALIHVMMSLGSLATTLSKISSDLRLLASGPRAGLGEITLPSLQKGSTIMAGKVNPVVPEMVNQIAFHVIGQMQTAFLVGIHGQLELNVMQPVFIKGLIESFSRLNEGVSALAQMIDQTKINAERCRELFEHSLIATTVLVPELGYDQVEKIVKNALSKGVSLRVALQKAGLSDQKIDQLFSSPQLTQAK